LLLRVIAGLPWRDHDGPPWIRDHPDRSSPVFWGMYSCSRAIFLSGCLCNLIPFYTLPWLRDRLPFSLALEESMPPVPDGGLLRVRGGGSLLALLLFLTPPLSTKGHQLIGGEAGSGPFFFAGAITPFFHDNTLVQFGGSIPYPWPCLGCDFRRHAPPLFHAVAPKRAVLVFLSFFPHRTALPSQAVGRHPLINPGGLAKTLSLCLLPLFGHDVI